MAKTQVPARKHAVILSGGGANGAYEVGVMKALFGGHVELPFDSREAIRRDPFGVFTGTSVGSFNAAFMASRPGRSSADTVAELDQVWRQRIAGSRTRGNGVLRLRGSPMELFNLDRVLADPLETPAQLFSDGVFLVREFLDRADMFFRSREEVFRRLMGLIDFSVLVCAEPLRDLVSREIDLEKILQNRDRTLVVAATNWEKGETELFASHGRVSESYRVLDEQTGHLVILASTAIPGIFPPVEIHRTRYVDGGLLMNTPLSPAIRCGADVIHVIYLDPDLKDVPLDGAGGTMDMLNRATSLAFASQVNRDIKQARTVNQMVELYGSLAGAVRELKLDRKESDRIHGIARAHRAPYQKQGSELRAVTIHRYHPASMLEGGIFGLLDFDVGRVSELIDIGFRDAVTHDCGRAKCIFPTLDHVRSAAAAGKRHGTKGE